MPRDQIITHCLEFSLIETGAHITIFGRKQHLLDEALDHILGARLDDGQIITAVAGDMGIASNVSILCSPYFTALYY